RKSDARFVLGYVSEWDTEDVARRFFGLYRTLLSKKWKKLAVERESEDRVEGAGDDGRFVLRREGARVSSLEGQPMLH
ncbi:MAG: hypothetical protein ACRD96_15660, partial [Bryobacteraceae bacterium]